MLAQAQTIDNRPRLVVNIAIDQLRTDFIEQYAPLYGNDGFRKLMAESKVYTVASYPFAHVDRASAIASVATGTTPYYNGIIGCQWLDRGTLRPVGCTDDAQYAGIYTLEKQSPKNLLTSTVGDELKINTQGQAIVYGIAPMADAAILSVGHAADGALWIDQQNGSWCSSAYYFRSIPKWLNEYAVTNKYTGYKLSSGVNTAVTNMALQCVEKAQMGADHVPDLLAVTYYAGADEKLTKRQEIYTGLDADLGRLISGIESRVGSQHVLFVITGTGYADDDISEYGRYRVPTGTFYINRTSNLLNIYLSAIYGQGRYVEGYQGQHIYLNHKLLEEKQLSLNEIMSRSEEFLIQSAGVRDVFTTHRLITSGNAAIAQVRNGFNTAVSGDILIEVAPGWNIVNEETHQTFQYRSSVAAFPIFIFGAGTPATRVTTPVTTDRIAPTISKAIRIRAPNACQTPALD